MKLAAKTCAGAAKMLLESGQHPGKLKDVVLFRRGGQLLQG